MKYIRELDVLRAIAILLVIIGHWSPQGSTLQKIFDGDMGVNIFFVLSGFLITWILLANRKKAEGAGLGKLSTFGNFYIRRTLRIFPIYYLCVFFFFFFPRGLVDNTAQIFPWLFTYTSNLYFFFYQRWDGHISHLWSLAVEEQFYFLWPSFMLFVNKKFLPYIIVAFIGLGIGVQFFLIGLPRINYFTVSCFSAFGIGAWLSYLLVYQPQSLNRFYKLLKVPAIISLILIVFGIFQTRWPALPMQRVFHSILAVFVITYIMVKRESATLKFRFIWNSRVLVFIGKISYGLYLYHGFIPFVVSDRLYSYFHFRPEEVLHPVVNFLFKFIIVVLISWLSWIFIEKPILSLKKYFEYNKEKKLKPILSAN